MIDSPSGGAPEKAPRWDLLGTEGCGRGNRVFVLGRPETQLHDILWAVHDGKNHGSSEGKENIGEFPVTVGGLGPSDARFSCTYARVCEALHSN